MSRGILISIEGIDGAGKTTQVKLLSQELKGLGYEVFTLREPGGTMISERIREILLDARNLKLSPMAEALLYEAARAQLVDEVLKPLLRQGKIVLADRFTDSTIAYQGYGRGLDIESLSRLNHMATGGIEPQLTVVLDLDPVEGRRRLMNKGLDRLEQEGLEFQGRVRQGYISLAQKGNRYRVVDGARGEDEVFQEILCIVLDFLKGWKSGHED